MTGSPTLSSVVSVLACWSMCQNILYCSTQDEAKFVPNNEAEGPRRVCVDYLGFGQNREIPASLPVAKHVEFPFSLKPSLQWQ